MTDMMQEKYRELINDEKVLKLINILVSNPSSSYSFLPDNLPSDTSPSNLIPLDPICNNCLSIIRQMSLYLNIKDVIIKIKKNEVVDTFHQLIYLVLLATKLFINYKETNNNAQRDELINTVLQFTWHFNDSLYHKDNPLLTSFGSSKSNHIKTRSRYLFMNDIVPRVIATVLTEKDEFYDHSNISMIMRACKNEDATPLEAIIEHITLQHYNIRELPFKTIWDDIKNELLRINLSEIKIYYIYDFNTQYLNNEKKYQIFNPTPRQIKKIESYFNNKKDNSHLALKISPKVTEFRRLLSNLATQGNQTKKTL